MRGLADRPRRLRRTAALRAMMADTWLGVEHLIQPLFVIEGEALRQPITPMPGQYRLSIDQLVAECRHLFQLGIQSVALFPSLDSSLKSADGAEALNPETLVLRAVRAVRAAVPDLQLLTDIALDPYTTHGHDGVLTADGSDVDNDRTVEILARMAVLHAAAGVPWVAPSDMMDGRVAAIRAALDAAGHGATGIVAYSAKFNSAYYGPFREAVGSAAAAGTHLLGKQTYQLDPSHLRAAQREVELDLSEGADVVMVKPAGPYLDVIRQTRELSDRPVAAYQVSGEYAQIHAAAQLGWLDLKRTRDESLVAIRRAGADWILTYFAAAWAADKAVAKPA
jgi:porphobilinogen synthase